MSHADITTHYHREWRAVRPTTLIKRIHPNMDVKVIFEYSHNYITEEEEEEEERHQVMVPGVTNGGLSHGNPHDNKQTYT